MLFAAAILVVASTYVGVGGYGSVHQQVHDRELEGADFQGTGDGVLKIQSELESLRRRLTQLGATGPQPGADATLKTVDEPSNPEMHNNWD